MLHPSCRWRLPVRLFYDLLSSQCQYIRIVAVRKKGQKREPEEAIESDEQPSPKRARHQQHDDSLSLSLSESDTSASEVKYDAWTPPAQLQGPLWYYPKVLEKQPQWPGLEIQLRQLVQDILAQPDKYKYKRDRNSWGTTWQV